ncbi:hypothetical protein HY745_00355, partial [Candidatus Desantisbacteria bacterium]|nr:hypothetical protein [Candidatus Desantisbacteria bacterium]
NSETKFRLFSKYYHVYIDGIGINPPLSSSYSTIEGSLEFKLSKNWRIIYFDYFRNSKIKDKFEMKDFLREEQRIEMTRDMHCWEAIFSIRQKYYSDESVLGQEFMVNFRLKAFPGQKLLELKAPSSPYSTYYNF